MTKKNDSTQIDASDLVLCESPDGWSLHAPGSTDEDIASGAARVILDGPGECTDADRERALALWGARERRNGRQERIALAMAAGADSSDGAALSPASLHDYATGEYIRDATWREVAESLRAPQAEGVIEVDGRSVYVTDEHLCEPTIRELLREAGEAGDEAQVHVCFVALGERAPGAGGQQWPASRAEAVAECARVTAEAEAEGYR